MAQIIYQPTLPGARGALKAGIPVVCRTADEGSRRAEWALTDGSIVGARVVRVLHDAEGDEFETPEHLGEMGRVPEEA